MKRLRGALATGGGILVAMLILVNAQAAELPRANNLQADAAQARSARLPILIFFAAESCPYCHIVEDDYLKPMFNSGKWANKVMFRKLLIDDERDLRDFHGDKVSSADFARAHGVSLTPHIKFFGPDGKELVPSLLGLMTRDFYAGYLEEAIESAGAKLRGR